MEFESITIMLWLAVEHYYSKLKQGGLNYANI